MIFLFFAVIGAMAIVGLFVFDMERKRQRMLDLLTRLGSLGKQDMARRLRDQNMRRLSMSIFFNGQLQAGLDREVSSLEQESDIPPPADSGKRYSMFTSKQLQSIEDRIRQLEVMLARDERVAKTADEPPTANPGSGDEESQPPPAQ